MSDAQQNELIGACEEFMREAVVLSADYLDVFRLYPDYAIIQGWEKARWMRALYAKVRLQRALEWNKRAEISVSEDKDSGLKEASPALVDVLGQNKLNEKVARLCGWTIHQIEVCGLADVAVLPPGVNIEDEGAVWEHAGTSIPDFCNDLNACHEFEKGLNRHQQSRYTTHLRLICGDAELANFNARWHPVHATAEQRCRAFIATMARDDVDRRDSSGAGNATTVSQIPLGEDKEGEKEQQD